MADRVTKYAAVPTDVRLYQGEILADLIQVRQTLSTIGSDGPLELQDLLHPFAIIMTQDCDLEADFRWRAEGKAASSPLANVLFCEAAVTTEMKGKVPQGKDIWKRVIQNKDERYQCLEAVPPELDSLAEGIPCLGCDFRRYFTVPTDEVYRRVSMKQMQRRCRLITPYAEHLLSRFCVFQARVPLPENHEVPL